jgi:hypothetical protein
MSNLIRFGVSPEEELIKSFDELSARRGYGNRSEALCDLMRDAHARLILAILLSICPLTAAQAQAQRTLYGTVVTGRNEAVAGATITVRSSAGELTATSDSEGNFKLAVPAEALIVKVTGKNLAALERKIDARELTGASAF